MSIGARAQHLRLVSPYRHFLRLWRVFCAVTSRTTPHSSLSMRHFMMSASLPSRFGYTYHCDEYQFALDRWRDRRLVARGFLPLRFTRKDVYAHQVVPDVLKAVECWGVSKSATKAAVSLG